MEVQGISMIMVLTMIIIFALSWILNRISIRRIRQKSEQIKDLSTVMRHTLNVSGNSVVKVNMHTGLISNMHGEFLPEEGINFQESYDYIHPDDLQMYKAFIERMLAGAPSAEYTFRWDTSLSEHKKQWRYFHGIGITQYANEKLKRPTTIFITLTDRTEQVKQEYEEEMLSGRYQRVFEQSIAGLAFYDKDGRLIAANKKMQEILKFQSEKDPFYYNQTFFEMPTFREVIVNNHVEELFFCTKSVIIERGVNCYTEMHVHPIYDEQNELVYITFSIRDITAERDIYLQNKQNDEIIRRTNKEIQQYESELLYLMESCDMRFWRASFITEELTFFKSFKEPERVITFKQFCDDFVDPENPLIKEFLHPREYFDKPRTYICHTKPILHHNDTPQWNILDSVPEYDDYGVQNGCYGVIRNVTELFNKQEQLKQETERANDSGHRKSVFMANMTHEIRTPLNAIVGFSDVLPMLQTPEEKQEIIKVIMNNCDMLMRLINDILAISAIDDGDIHIEPAQTDFAQDFNGICATLAQRVQLPTVKFIGENPYSSLVVEVDKERITQVITNFVTNAVKYTQQGHIKVGYEYLEGNDKGLYIYCEDTGAGIPKEDQEKIFERFVKLNDYVQGTGLGLNISKAIAEGCHGKIGVKSEGQGHGSTFWIWIPCEATSQPLIKK